MSSSLLPIKATQHTRSGGGAAKALCGGGKASELHVSLSPAMVVSGNQMIGGTRDTRQLPVAEAADDALLKLRENILALGQGDHARLHRKEIRKAGRPEGKPGMGKPRKSIDQ